MACLICDRIQLIIEGNNPYFVTELETGYVVVGDYQYYRGYALFLCKSHCSELHELDPLFKLRFLKEMSIVAEAMYMVCRPLKLNYELLGNTDAHLHWHLFPRYIEDPQVRLPVWVTPKATRESDATRAVPTETARYAALLRDEIQKVSVRDRDL